MRYKGPIFRPPSEADSYLLQVTYGCSHNLCTFCGMYPEVDFGFRNREEILEDIQLASLQYPDTRRIFLTDGDALAMATDDLAWILERLNEHFPKLQRTGIYVYGPNFKDKSVDDLKRLRELGLKIGYMGVESGSEEVLRRVVKGCTAADMVEGARMMKEADVKLSAIILIGLGGRELWEVHAVESAKVINRMSPTYLSLLTLTVIPGTPLDRAIEKGLFELPSPLETLKEIKAFINNLDLSGTIFRSNHASNYLPLKGRFPKDKETLVRILDEAIEGKVPLRPEFLRGL
jgi:radical SAM superfamily enzyme YgiQ (UPF0313 family)